MDDWGLDDYIENKPSNKPKGQVQWGKAIVGIVTLVVVLSLLVYAFYPKNKVTVKAPEDNKSYDVGKASDNYGYPGNVEVPDKVKDTVKLYEEVGQDVSDSDKAKLEAVRDAASIHEAGWDVKKLGSRKFLDTIYPVDVELELINPDSVIAKLLNNAPWLHEWNDPIPDGTYILINPLDERQMYWKQEIYDYLNVKKSIDKLSLVYVTDKKQHNVLANFILFAAGYGKESDDMYPIEPRIKEVHDYPMMVTVKDNKVVAKKTKIDNFKEALAGWR